MTRSFDPKILPKPKDFQHLFAFSANPLDIEIGCGVGYHPLQYAAENPKRTLVAFERTKEKFEKFQGRLNHHKKFPNLIAIHGDAIAWICNGIKPKSVDQYFLLYPNPYPKEKQRNHRWFAMPFMSYLLETLKAKGTITLATNMEFYYEEAKELAQKDWDLKILVDDKIDQKTKPRTHFEKKYLARGEACWNLVLQKN